MNDTPATPSAEEISGVLRESQGVQSASVIEGEWIRIQGQNRSLVICANAERTRSAGQLKRGAELLDSADAGILFVDSPRLFIVSAEETPRGDIDVLGWSEEEITTTLSETVSKLVQEGFDEYPDISFRDLTRLFCALLSPADEAPPDEVNARLGQEQDGFLPPLPLELEAGIMDLVASWVLRGDPKRIADFGSGGDALTAALADHRDEAADLYLVDVPSHIARVGRLTSAYRRPEACLGNTPTLPYSAIFGENQPQKSLKQFTDEEDDGSDLGISDERFDAIVSGLVPDTIREASEEIRDRMIELGVASAYTGLSTYLAVEGIQHLAEGGRGAFFLTLGQMARFDILERALDAGRVHSVLLIGRPGEMIGEWPLQPLAVVLFENTSSASESEDVRVVEVTSETFDPRTNRLIQAPLTQVSSEDVADIEGLEYRTISAEDIEQLATRLILYEPQLAPFLRADETVPLEQFVDSVRRNRPTGANDFFYFEKTEVEESGLSRRFLTPVVKRPPEDSSLNLTPEKTSHYALDLREYIESLKERDTGISEESVLQSLREDGYTRVVDYIEDHRELADRATFQHRDLWFCPFRRRDQSSEVLLFGRYSDGSWYRLQDSDVIVDQNWYVFECDPEIAGSLHRLLNSEPYQNLLTYFGHSGNRLYQSVSLSDLQGLPVATGPLKEGLDDLPFPPTRRREQRRLDEAVVERCRDQTTTEALGSLLDPDDRFAWAWFLSPEEYEEFKEMYNADEERAEGFIADRLHENELREMLDHIAESDLHTERWDIIEELAEEYQQENYRLFMYGATPQFEGFIMDWAKRNGHTVVWRDGRPYVEISSQDYEADTEPIPKGLGALIDAFLPRGFGDFLRDEVKELRDATAHGEVITNSKEQAAICFLSLHTLALQISEGKLRG
jgi:hypothetical protein